MSEPVSEELFKDLVGNEKTDEVIIHTAEKIDYEGIEKDGYSIIVNNLNQYKKYLNLKNKSEEILTIKRIGFDAIDEISKITNVVFNKFSSKGRFVFLKIGDDNGVRGWDKRRRQTNMYDGRILFCLGGQGLGYQRFYHWAGSGFDNEKLGEYLSNNSQLTYVSGRDGEELLAYFRMMLEIKPETLSKMKLEFTDAKFTRLFRFAKVLITNKELLSLQTEFTDADYILEKPITIFKIENCKSETISYRGLSLSDRGLDDRFYKYELSDENSNRWHGSSEGIMINDLMKIEQCYSTLMQVFEKHKAEMQKRVDILVKLKDDLAKEFEREMVFNSLKGDEPNDE